MDYQHIKDNKPGQFLALTSLKPSEFDYLLRYFRPHWEKYYRWHTLEGKKRKHPATKEHKGTALQGTGVKLFFLLSYLKAAPLQEFHGASFGVSQPTVSRIVHTMLPILDETLKAMGLSPCRDGAQLQTMLEEHASKVFQYDVTARGICRNGDWDAQAVEFSGKHYAHKIKNIVLTDDTQYVHFLSHTCDGSEHDKAIADECDMAFPDGSVVKHDLGFLRHKPQGAEVEEPDKKPRGGELTFAQHIRNRILASTRIVVEHANSGIKRLRIVKDTIRLKSTWVRDMVMAVACALHNLRVTSEERSYQKFACASI